MTKNTDEDVEDSLLTDNVLTIHSPETSILRNKIKPNDAAFFFRKRYYVILSILIGWMMLTILRTNLSICLADMTSNKTFTSGNITYVKEAEFHWTSFEEGIILSSFAWGYSFALLGGIIASQIGGIKTYSYGILLTGILTMLSPVAMKYHFGVYLVARFFEGVFEGISSASLGEIFFRWVPPDERTTLTNVSLLGFSLGIMVGYPFVGYLIHTYNWEIAFYITGGIAILWSLVITLSNGESPLTDKFISKVEIDYFRKQNITASKGKIVHPWKKMLTSAPLWALLNEQFVEAWSSSFLAYCLPLYIKDVYDVNMEQLGWLSSLPYYFQFFGKIPAALLADYLRRNKIFTQTSIHKTYILSGQIGGILMLTIAGITDQFILSLIVLSLFNMFFSLAMVSYGILPLDIGACHSALIYGLCRTAVSLGNMLNPPIMGLFVENHTAAEWHRYFFFLSFFNVWATVIFAYFGSGELQPWAVQEKHENNDKTKN